MKKLLLFASVAGTVLLLFLAVFLGVHWQENRTLRAEQQRRAQEVRLLEERLATMTTASNELTMRLAKAETDLQAAHLTASNATAALAALEAKASNGVTTNYVLPRSYQVPVQLGNKNLGLAWAVPTNVRKDPKTGRVLFDQVIHLPEQARGSLTTYVTNVIEQPVYGPPQVIERNNNYYVDRGYSWHWMPHAGRPVDPDRNRPVPPARPIPNPPTRNGIFVPPSAGDPGIYRPPDMR